MADKWKEVRTIVGKRVMRHEIPKDKVENLVDKASHKEMFEPVDEFYMKGRNLGRQYLQAVKTIALRNDLPQNVVLRVYFSVNVIPVDTLATLTHKSRKITMNATLKRTRIDGSEVPSKLDGVMLWPEYKGKNPVPGTGIPAVMINEKLLQYIQQVFK